ncbi:hypothetical protein MAR_018813 [Mya arenaria]|uniref:Uncharacterized protein n=1 Tax=Mya arenaria TaxID=6604 RepID=A0ABY7EFR6_MYAAR|nr:hypothetical protein MAR_018813 [Mya arenaria]
MRCYTSKKAPCQQRNIEIVPKKEADSVVKERQTEEFDVDDCIVPQMSTDIELPLDEDKKCQVKFAIEGGLKPAADMHDINIVDIPCQTETVSPGLVAVSISGGATSGVSSYVPRPGDNIVFNFTIYEKGNCTDHETTTETPSKMSSNPQVVTSTQKFRYTVCNDTMKTCCPPSVRLGIEDKQPLIYYMEKACDKYPKKFKKFTVSYKQSLNGYVVVAINEVIGNRDEKTIWRILNATGRVDLGASSYVPTPDDEITLRFENQDKSTPCPNNCNGCCHIL